MADDVEKSPEGIYREFTIDQEYKNRLALFDIVKKNNNFYHGKQWEGLNAPALEKPVFNVIKPAVNYLTSMLVTDDIGVNVEVNHSFGDEQSEVIKNVLRREVGNVFEANNIGYQNRESITSCAIDGDTVRHHYWDGSVETGYAYQGAIKMERIDNTNIIFGDCSTNDIQLQPYLILVSKLLTRDVRRMARQNGVANVDDIVADDEIANYYNDEHSSNDSRYTTVFLKYWKDDSGMVCFMKTTSRVVLVPESQTGLRLYPISYFSWEKVKHCCHGTSPVSAVIANQIYINKVMALAMEYNKRMAFPKLIYDKTKLTQGWSNDVTKAVAVNGDPREAVFSVFQAAPVNAQALELVESTINKTKDSLGIYDAALGNAKPDNTSAIVALQRASSQPLELQRMDFYQFIEDSVRIIVEMMGAYYGQRYTTVEMEGNTQAALYDFTQLSDMNLSLTVEIGQATYWSELMQVQTLDNMLSQQLINSMQYLELLPDGYIPGRDKIIKSMQEQQGMAGMMGQGQEAMGQTEPLAQLQQALMQGGSMV